MHPSPLYYTLGVIRRGQTHTHRGEKRWKGENRFLFPLPSREIVTLMIKEYTGVRRK